MKYIADSALFDQRDESLPTAAPDNIGGGSFCNVRKSIPWRSHRLRRALNRDVNGHRADHEH